MTEHDVVANLGHLFEAAKSAGIVVAISPHHDYPWDHTWKIQAPLEVFQHEAGIFDRKGPYMLDGFRDSGADFLPDDRVAWIGVRRYLVVFHTASCFDALQISRQPSWQVHEGTVPGYELARIQ